MSGTEFTYTQIEKKKHSIAKHSSEKDGYWQFKDL
jgi:hypothetical protein